MDLQNYTQLKFIVRKLYSVHNYFKEEKVESICDNLVNKDYTLEQVRKGCELAAETYKQQPSYAEVLECIRIANPVKPQEEKNKNDGCSTYLREQNRLINLKKSFAEIVSGKPEDLLKYTRAWLKNVYPDMVQNNQYVALKESTFTLPALIDWEDAEFSSDFEKIWHIGISKNEWINQNMYSTKTITEIPRDVVYKARSSYLK